MPMDLNRGVTQRRHKTLGMYIGMYKDEPGVYYDTNGNVVDEKFASEAGFNIKEHAVDRRRRDEIAKAEAKANAEAQVELERINREAVEAEIDAEDQTENFFLQALGGGWWNVVHKATQQPANASALRREAAEELMRSSEGGGETESTEGD